MTKFLFPLALLTSGIFFLSSPARAYLSLAESGELVPAGQYQIGAEPQFLLNHGGGANMNVFFDAPVNDSTSARITLGGGSVDFSTMASLKFVPFPDVDNQPAIGVRVGVGAARDESENILFGQVAPLVSKKVDTEYGLMTPYVAVPFELMNTKEDNHGSSQFVVGSEYTHPDLPQARFGAEVGMELSKSYTYLSIFATLPFDSSKGIF